MDVRPTNDQEGREELREKGQFFTPQWITTAMSAFILRGNPTQIFEPGFGTGAFFVGATSAAESMGVDLPVYRGCETDESALTRAIDQGSQKISSKTSVGRASLIKMTGFIQQLEPTIHPASSFGRTEKENSRDLQPISRKEN